METLDRSKITHKHNALCQNNSVPQSLPDLAELLPSWELALKAERKSPQTVDSYTRGVTLFLRWCAQTDTSPEMTRTKVQAFISALLDGGAEPATARSRHMALRRYAAWLADEGEIETNPLIGVKPPKLDTKVTAALTDDQLKKLIGACKGKELIDRRDEAIVRLMCETGLRAGEVLGMNTDDVDLGRGIATVRRGKGGKGRIVPFGPQTASAIDRYVRARRTHRLADTGALWLGGGGQQFGYHGLNVALKRRAQAAGIAKFHLHLMRHTAATRWLRAGGSEQGLMSVAGWSTRSMLDRYTGASAAERAAAEARGLNLGDL
ncbi:tyrosine-type recombinase/integrase [Mycolicibacterium austroafricanum]|uniref:Tyrosine-type recombinase/integrase n=1 Tax=Mycolicibacterium austroafricanum TaxID=39687 RepID=A0ABT8HHS4_MYCAO|nr:tyrosine-type recombinase/integrase [Mycolicibacterium austroafricanum]MDN4520315.1 tyrosine-type recombinase/integrase [Mycolicibacterium austroafricanum]